MKKLSAVSLMLLAVSLVLLPAARLHAQVEISTIEQLQDINKNTTALSGNYILAKNIDAGATASWNNGQGFVPIGKTSTPFSGTFDGNGFIIGRLTIKRNLMSNVGLFGYTSNATIKNVGLEGVDITGNQYVGGLVGQGKAGEFTNSYSTGTVFGNSYVGGLAGILIGGKIENTFSTAAAKASSRTGGLIGQNNQGTVFNCYSTGAVGETSSLLVGGLVGGTFNNGTVTSSYWDTETSGRNTSIGSDANAGKTTAQMMEKETYTGWDFSTIWCIDENAGYPCLHVFPDTCECSSRLTNPNPGGNPTGATVPAFTVWGILLLAGMLIVIAALANSKNNGLPKKDG